MKTVTPGRRTRNPRSFGRTARAKLHRRVSARVALPPCRGVEVASLGVSSQPLPDPPASLGVGTQPLPNPPASLGVVSQPHPNPPASLGVGSQPLPNPPASLGVGSQPLPSGMLWLPRSGAVHSRARSRRERLIIDGPHLLLPPDHRPPVASAQERYRPAPARAGGAPPGNPLPPPPPPSVSGSLGPYGAPGRKRRSPRERAQTIYATLVPVRQG